MIPELLDQDTIRCVMDHVRIEVYTDPFTGTARSARAVFAYSDAKNDEVATKWEPYWMTGDRRRWVREEP